MSRPPALGVDVGGTSVKWAITVGDEPAERGVFPTPGGSGQILAAIGELIARVRDRIAAVGVTLPGLVDTERRLSLFIPNLPGDWNGLPVGEILGRETGIDVALINDARAFAYGELAAGAAQGETDVLFLSLGTGVGGAIAFRGRLLIGDVDALGEAGHTVVDPGGYLCGCGGRGCLETVASASAIVARATRVRMMSLSPLLEQLVEADLPLTAVHVASAARLSDPHCADIFRRAGEGIGIAGANAATLLRIRTVVLGGGLASAFDLLAPAAEAVLSERAALYDPVALRPALLGSAAGSVGAALFAADGGVTAYRRLKRGTDA